MAGDTRPAEAGQLRQANRLGEIAHTAAQLAAALDELIAQNAQEDYHEHRLMEHVRLLEGRDKHLSAWRRELERAMDQSVSPQDVQETAALVDGLVREPTDLLAMSRISAKAVQLAAIIRTYGELRRLLEEGPGLD